MKVLNIYRFNWTEMSGGFPQEVNIIASTEAIAKQIYIDKVNNRISIADWPATIRIKEKKLKHVIHFIETID